MNHSRRENGYYMRGSCAPHSLCDVHLLVLYILPCFFSFDLGE
jgi:hypothetical protein